MLGITQELSFESNRGGKKSMKAKIPSPTLLWHSRTDHHITGRVILQQGLQQSLATEPLKFPIFLLKKKTKTKNPPFPKSLAPQGPLPPNPRIPPR